MLAVVAAFVMAVHGASAPFAHAAQPGMVMVICADGVEKTVVIDRAGNPAPASEHEPCDWVCQFCPVAQADTGLLHSWTHAVPMHPATKAFSNKESIVRATRRGQRRAPRGLPSEDAV
jgi:hypothetical protein